MKLTIADPDQTIFEGEAKLIQLPGTDGSFEVLENHAPVIALLKKGNVRVVDNGNQETTVVIEGGLFSMADNACRIAIL